MPVTVVNFAAAMAIPQARSPLRQPDVLVGGLTVSRIGTVWLSRRGADTPYLTGIALPLSADGARLLDTQRAELARRRDGGEISDDATRGAAKYG